MNDVSMKCLMSSLAGLGVSELETKIYLALLDSGALSPYQIAKKVNISRSSIYNALEHMLNKGMVEVVPEENVMYMAQDPDVLISKLEKDYKSNIEVASRELKEYMATRYEEKYAILHDKDIILEKTKKLIQNAKQEIFINTDIDLNELKDELEKAAEKQVRVIVFSFIKQEMNCVGVEIYSHERAVTKGDANTRLMIVADDDMALFADACNGRGDWKGTVTNNELMKNIIKEHIHNDIYMLKLRKIYGREIYDKIFINTSLEKKQF